MKKFIKNMMENYKRWCSEVHETKKIKNPKRVEIYRNYNLSKEQKKEIDEYYLKNYGKKIPYEWHRYVSAVTDNFQLDYFPELLYIPEFERYMNFDISTVKFLEDKNNLYMIQKYLNINLPKKIISCQSGIFMDKDNNILNKDDVIKIIYDIGEVFCKISVNSDSGKGCKLLFFKKGTEINSGLKVEKLLNTLGKNFIIQERLKCHESIAEIYPDSVNTFRIITYRWKDKIYHMPCTMRIGRNGRVVDNGHAGGIFIALDDDGTFHDKATTEYKEEFFSHPNTNYVFKGKKIGMFPKVLKKCIDMHEHLPNVGVINWDITIDENGELTLIEINIAGGSIWLPQLSHGKSIFGDLTPEILRWLAFMKKTKLKDREKYIYGRNMKESNK